MKAALFAMILGLGSMASAATTTCVVMGKGSGEQYDQLLAQKFVAQTGEATELYRSDVNLYMAIDNGQNLSIAQAAGNQVSVLASGNGNRLVVIDVAHGIGVACSRQ